MHLTHSYNQGAWSVTKFVGELDVVGAPKLRQDVLNNLQQGCNHLVLDLSSVDFIDSFGLGVVVGALKRTRLVDGDLRVVVPKPAVRKVFEICDLDQVFILHTTVQEAVLD